MKFNIAVLGAVLAVVGCSPVSDKLVPKQEFKVPKKAEKLGKIQPFEAKIDILFVIDDSGSMGSHQTNLATNIDRFVKEFTKLSYVDFQIGAMTSDSIEYDPWNGGYTKKPTSGDLKDVGNTGFRFVTRNTPNVSADLSKRMKVGTSGSGTEAFFDPILDGLSNTKLATTNRGFIRSDAFLAIIILTDTEDQSLQGTGTLVKTFLDSFKGQNRYSVYAGLATNFGGRTCARDDADKNILTGFLLSVKAQTFSLCDPSFGNNLVGIAEDLVNRVARVIPLASVPQSGTIKVFYGNQQIPNDPINGWVYDPQRVAIILGPKVVLKDAPGATLDVQYSPAKLD